MSTPSDIISPFPTNNAYRSSTSAGIQSTSNLRESALKRRQHAQFPWEVDSVESHREKTMTDVSRIPNHVSVELSNSGRVANLRAVFNGTPADESIQKTNGETSEHPTGFDSKQINPISVHAPLAASNSHSNGDQDSSFASSVFQTTEPESECIRFVRKRAYASARPADRFEHVPSLELDQERSDMEDNAASLACHRLPAAPQPDHLTSMNAEPKITRLPRRHSTRNGHTGSHFFPRRFSDAHKTGMVPIGPPHGSYDEALPEVDSLTQSPVNFTETVASNDQRPPLAPRLSKSPPQQSSRSATTNQIKLRSSDRLFTSFDECGSMDSLWVKAGEAYQSIALADKRIAQRRAKLQARQLSGSVDLSTNKENKELEPNRVSILGMSPASSQPMSTASPSHRRTEMTTHSFSKASQLGSLVNGICRNRPKTVARSGPVGSFLSRQCLCRILTVGGSTRKSSWKPYYLSVTSKEVRFIKVSTFRAVMGSKSSLTEETFSVGSAGEMAMDTSHLNETSIYSGSFDEVFPRHSNIGSNSKQLVLPITGLTWHPEDLPSDLPLWNPLDLPPPSQQPPPPHPSDKMDPHLSGISRAKDPSLSTVNTHTTVRETDARPRFECYRFVHLSALVELLLLFPDDNMAMTCLKLCEVRLMFPLDHQIHMDHTDSQRNPYNLKWITQSNSKVHSDLTKPIITTVAEKPLNRKNVNLTALSASEQTPYNTQGNVAIHDRRRYRRTVVRPSDMDELLVLKSHDVSFPEKDPSHRSASRKFRSKHDQPSPDSADSPGKLDSVASLNYSVDDKSRGSTRTAGSKAPIMQSLKHLFNRPGNPAEQRIEVNTSNAELRSTSVPNDSPDGTDFNSPGPIFGAPLEQQVESPDHAYVPVFIQSFVAAIEGHGLHLSGLYRKPGRQRAINEFVSTVNCAPENVASLMEQEAWREPHALCGLVKLFLRRLPSRLLDLSAWRSLSVLVPDKDLTLDKSRLAYLLLSIRFQLWKLAYAATGRVNRLALPLDSMENELSGLTLDVARSPGFNSSTLSPSPVSPGIGGTVSEASVLSARWRWSTLSYLIGHLRRIISLDKINDVNFQCAAICFGPALFGDTSQVDRLNVVLEQLLRHWEWLIDGLPKAEDSDQISSSHRSPNPGKGSDLSAAINYLQQSERLSDAQPLKSSPDSTLNASSCKNNAISAPRIESIIQRVESLLKRAFEQSAKPESSTPVPVLGRRLSAGPSKSPQRRLLNRTRLPDFASPRRRATTHDHSLAMSSLLPTATTETQGVVMSTTATPDYNPVTIIRRPTIPRTFVSSPIFPSAPDFHKPF